MRLPRILRILVIDDKVAADPEIREGVRNVLTCLAYRAKKGSELEHVDVVFAGTPEEGVQKWQEEVFDLALFDSKFESDPKRERERKVQRDTGLTGLPDFYARYAGLLAFQAIRSLMREDERYHYRSTVTQPPLLCMWSSLDRANIEKILGSAQQIGGKAKSEADDDGLEDSPLPDGRYLAKVPRPEASTNSDQPRDSGEVFEQLRGVVDQAVQAAMEPQSPEQLAERFVNLYKARGSLPAEVQSWIPFLDGYLVRSDPELPWLDEILPPDSRAGSTADGGQTSPDGEAIQAPPPQANAGQPHIYFTIRKPKASHGALQEDGDIDLGTAVRVVHLGPSSRDVGQPLAAIVAHLFPPEPRNADDTPGKQADDEPEQLSTVRQLDLLHRRPAKVRETGQSSGESLTPSDGQEGGNEEGGRGVAIEAPMVGGDGGDTTEAAGTAVEGAGKKRSALTGVIEAAATPLTGVSTVGLSDARAVLREKCKAMLHRPFDRAVLKTTYLDKPAAKADKGFLMPEWQGIRWPALQAQSHHRTRCLRSAGHPRTLWNTGVTALEMFTPEMLNGFLRECADDADRSVFGDNLERLVVSLGSKYPQADGVNACYRREGCDLRRHECAFRHDLEHLVWEPLFKTVFDGLVGRFPNVEINVRHYLRENVEFHIGGDEYMSPNFPGGKFTENYEAALTEFSWWLETLHKVAVHHDHKKRLILKFPFRSDVFAFLDVVLDFCRRHPPSPEGHGIQGICLINAFKSAVCEAAGAPEFSPAWYSLPGSWRDAAGRESKYQMSGEMLNASRNMLIYKLLEFRSGDGNLKPLELHFGGGVVSLSDLAFCQTPSGFPRKHQSPAVQIGTWALLDLKLGEQFPAACQSAGPVSLRKARAKGRCRGEKCGSTCAQYVCQNRAISVKGGSLWVDTAKCTGCFACMKRCSANFEMDGSPAASDTGSPRGMSSAKAVKEIVPRICSLLHERCIGCGKCSRSFYCDTFLDRRGGDLHPLMDPRNCTGCGLCAQICPTGALQLFSPEHVAALISGPGERSDLLNALQVPHLTYAPVADLALFGWPRECSLYKQALGFLSNDEAPSNGDLCEWAAALWRYRLTHDRLPRNSSFPADSRWKNWIETDASDEVTDGHIEKVVAKATALLEALELALNGEGRLRIEETVLLRAFVWSQLIWSDPGQVLWESPIVVARTTARLPEGWSGHMFPSSGQVEATLWGLLSIGFSVTTHWLVLREGKVEEALQSTSVDELQLALNEEQLKSYAQAGLGQGRLLGLDLRACRGMLKKRDGGVLNEDEVMTVSGLPWHAMRKSNIESLQKIECERDKRLAATKGIGE